MQCSISIIYCHYYYYSLTNKIVIISIAHVMKKQEVRVTSAHVQCSRKSYVSYLNKSANALALCHPPSASFCSVLAVQWSSHIFTQDI